MIEGIDQSPLGSTDAGEGRDTRRPLCTKHAWCIEPRGHDGTCTEVARAPHAPADFGPRRGKP